MSRSRIALLRLIAMRFEGNSPDHIVSDLRKFAEELEARTVDGRVNDAAQQRRVERQRTLFAMLPSTSAVDQLREAIMQRAYDLMWDGDGLACDALAEFLPSKSAEEMFDAWERDWLGETADKSRFFKGG